MVTFKTSLISVLFNLVALVIEDSNMSKYQSIQSLDTELKQLVKN